MTCDPHWHAAWKELLALHVEKSSTYGKDDDRFSNFTAVGDATGEPPELYVLLRMAEKTHRAINMIRAGRSLDVKEYPDLASLALCAEALRRRQDIHALFTPPPPDAVEWYDRDESETEAHRRCCR